MSRLGKSRASLRMLLLAVFGLLPMALIAVTSGHSAGYVWPPNGWSTQTHVFGAQNNVPSHGALSYAVSTSVNDNQVSRMIYVNWINGLNDYSQNDAASLVHLYTIDSVDPGNSYCNYTGYFGLMLTSNYTVYPQKWFQYAPGPQVYFGLASACSAYLDASTMITSSSSTSPEGEKV